MILQFLEKPLGRWIFGLGVPVLIVIAGGYLYKFGSPFHCLFLATTGLYCPGCGSGRAAFDFVHLDVIEAIEHNILFVLFTPFVAYYFLKQYIRIVFRKDILPFYDPKPVHIKWILIIIVVFFVLRNIPLWPFDLLSQ